MVKYCRLLKVFNAFLRLEIFFFSKSVKRNKVLSLHLEVTVWGYWDIFAPWDIVGLGVLGHFGLKIRQKS